MPNKIKHLNMIEAIIERMGKNCFQLKGWTMTLVVAVSALSSQGSDRRFIALAFIPILGFWILDSFYLQQERKYRLLYKNIVIKQEEDIDFNLDSDLATGSAAELERLCFFKCMFSVTEVWFYLLITLAMTVLVVILNFNVNPLV